MIRNNHLWCLIHCVSVGEWSIIFLYYDQNDETPLHSTGSGVVVWCWSLVLLTTSCCCRWCYYTWIVLHSVTIFFLIKYINSLFFFFFFLFSLLGQILLFIKYMCKFSSFIVLFIITDSDSLLWLFFALFFFLF